jgi:hypothetical protein
MGFSGGKKYDEIYFRSRHDGIKDQFEETTATRSETRRKELTTIINIAKPLSTYLFHMGHRARERWVCALRFPFLWCGSSGGQARIYTMHQ